MRSDENQPVRVFVSYEALADFDPTNVRDLHAAHEHFDKFRDRIEQTASQKFDSGDLGEERYEGGPTVRQTTQDF